MKVLYWNIENFYGDSVERAVKVISHVRETDPDIIGFAEIKDKAALRSILQDALNDYDFGVTDGKEGIEILAGWKRGVFEQALYTQRREFKVGNENLRPGALLSVKLSGKFTNILFMHADSGRLDKDYNNRQDMFDRIWSLKRRLEELEEGPPNFLVLGDLNTMGKKARGGSQEITGEQEIANLAKDAKKSGMILLDKTHQFTWAKVKSDGGLKMTSNLDHILISDNLNIKDGIGLVRGWVDLDNNAEVFEFVENISDHCSVECEIDL